MTLGAGFEPLAVDFAAVAGSHEGVDMILFHVLEKSSVFMLGEKGLNLHARLFCKSSFYFIQGTSSDKFLNNVFADSVIVLGNNADPLSAVEALHEIVDCQTIEPGTDDTDYNHPETVSGDEYGRQTDCNASESDTGSYVNVHQLVHNHSHDVQPPG